MSHATAAPRLVAARAAPRRRMKLSWSDPVFRALGDSPWPSFRTELHPGPAVICVAFRFTVSKYSCGLERERGGMRGC
jgi:hypothetical protein